MKKTVLIMASLFVILLAVHDAVSAPKLAPPPWLRAFGHVESICTVAAVHPRFTIADGHRGCGETITLMARNQPDLFVAFPNVAQAKVSTRNVDVLTVTASHAMIPASTTIRGSAGQEIRFWGGPHALEVLYLGDAACMTCTDKGPAAPLTIPIARRMPPPGTLVNLVSHYIGDEWDIRTVRLGKVSDNFVNIGHEKSYITKGSFVIFRGEIVAVVTDSSEAPQFIEYANVPRVIGKYIPGRPAYGYTAKAIAAHLKWAEAKVRE